MRHFINTQEALDKIAFIVAEEKQAEIEALKADIKRMKKEGHELCRKYDCEESNFDLFADAHDLYDFLMGL